MDTAGTDAEEPRYYSQAGADFMHQELQRLRAENEQLRRDVEFWQHQTNHWYLRANYTPAQIADFTRRRAALIDSLKGNPPLDIDGKGGLD